MLITRLLGLIPIAAAVLVENAFVNELFLQSVGHLNSVSFVDNCGMIGASSTLVVRLNVLNDNYIDWQVESPFRDSNNTHTFLSANFNDLYVYSPDSDYVYMYKSLNGVLVAKFRLNGSPKQLLHFFHNQVLILDSSGNTWVLKDGNTIKLPIDTAKSLAFWHMNGLGQLYVDSRKRYVIDDNGNISQNMDVSVQGEIVDGRGVSLLTNKLWYHVGNKHKLAIDSILGTGDYAVGIAKLVTKFYDQKGKVVNVIATQGDVLIVEHQLSEYLVDFRGDTAKVYDLTDFILDGEPSSIKETIINFPSEVDTKNAHYGVSLSSYGPVMIVYEEGRICTYLLQTGKMIFHFQLNSSLARAFIIMDRAASKAALEKEHDLLEDASGLLLLSRWVHRVKRHLTELGEFVISQLQRGSQGAFTPIESGMDKLLVYINSHSNLVTAIFTMDGKPAWHYTIDSMPDGIYVSKGNVMVTSRNQIWTFTSEGELIDHNEFKFDNARQVYDEVVFKRGDKYQIYGNSTAEYYYVDHDASEVWGVKRDSKTWKFGIDGHKVLKVSGHASGAALATVGIPTHDRGLLYKYLNPNVVAVITGCEEGMSLFLLDGVNGQLLFTQTNTKDKVDFNSVKIVVKDNFVIYSYAVIAPKVEQRLVVVDLFDSEKGSLRSENEQILEFSFDVSPQHFSTKLFIYPERILDLEVTTTKYGITLRLIIIVTATGQLVELPKYILNSRRIDNRQLKQEDILGDYGMTPYEPVIAKNSYLVLNHKIPLNVITTDHSLVIKPTNYESSLVFCYANEQNIFCGLTQPLASFDLLGYRFDKQKLVATIVVILIAYVGVKPFVANKKLNQNWVDKRA